MGLGMRRRNVRIPLHDPYAEGALVLYAPPTLSAHDALKLKESQPNPSTTDSSLNGELKVGEAGARGGGPRPVEGPAAPPARGRPVHVGLRHGREDTGYVYSPFRPQHFTHLSSPLGSQGCIMADEMGLGKTLQCIALIWTLLRQSPEV